jgi:DNA polymerase-3 subunit epsilon
VRFTAIDFETANSARASACSVGLIMVEDGRIVDKAYHLIRPEPLYFEPMNVSIHGITARDVVQAPYFRDIWPTMMEQFNGPLVAHNAGFDMSVIRHELDAECIPYPETDYFCTLVISRITWPQYPAHNLDRVAQHLGIDFNHHDALEDARACALIAIEACKIHGVETLADLKEACGLRIGSLHHGGYHACGGPKKRR